MEQYKHLLIASDLSEDSLSVGKKALALAEKNKAKLSIIHIVSPPPLFYGGGEFVIPMDVDIEETLSQEAQNNLEKQSKQLGIPKREQWVMMGHLSDELSDIVKKKKIDLIVMGAHNRHGLSLLLPSATDSVVHALPCDIWLVKI